jgi:pyruvate/2-oxoglutarate dehydrogenase complex dihydrolipoamide acyltransferase (E2) component
MTTEYYEFIGKEPSLKTLEKFIKINKKEFDEYNTECIAKNYENEKIDYSVIVEYLDFANRYTKNEYYYIGGHIKMEIDDPITEKSINDATKKNNESIPEHMMEVASKARSTKCPIPSCKRRLISPQAVSIENALKSTFKTVAFSLGRAARMTSGALKGTGRSKFESSHSKQIQENIGFLKISNLTVL